MSDVGLSFEPLFPIGVVSGVSLVALVFLTWQELRKKHKWIAYRIVASSLIIISIAGLVLQPSFSSEQASVIILTPGYDPLKVDSVLKLNPDLRILRSELADPFRNSVGQRSWNLDGEDVKYIFGEGLPEYALERISNSSFVFLPTKLPSGVQQLNIPEIFAGRENSLSGIFRAQQRTKLKLVGPAGSEDSTFVDNNNASFTLSFKPKQSGLFVFHLVAEGSSAAKTSERLPIEIKPEMKLRILFMQDFPSPEFRYLKNHLGAQGHSVVVRTRTSKSNFTEEFINTPKFQLRNVSADLLNRFDLLLSDSKAIEGLTTQEKLNVEQAVRNGLGLLVIQEKPAKKNEFYSIRGKVTSIDTAHVLINRKAYVLSCLPIEVTRGMEVESVTENRRRTLAGYRFLGAGKIGFQLLQETFRMKLQGDTVDYGTIWSTLIERISRRKVEDFMLKLDTHFPFYTDEPMVFSLTTNGKTAEVFSDSIKTPLQEDVVIDDYWHGNVWTGRKGWHQLRVNDSTKFNYFVCGQSEWRSLRAANVMNQTKASQDQKVLKNKYPLTTRTPVSSVLFFLVFLIAGAFLWLAAKI